MNIDTLVRNNVKKMSSYSSARDDFKKDWAVSEDNCFCRVFYPSGRLHWEKRDCFVSYQNPTPIFSENHLA